MRAAKESAASAMGRYYLPADEDREVTPAELKQFFLQMNIRKSGRKHGLRHYQSKLTKKK